MICDKTKLWSLLKNTLFIVAIELKLEKKRQGVVEANAFILANKWPVSVNSYNPWWVFMQSNTFPPMSLSFVKRLMKTKPKNKRKTV